MRMTLTRIYIDVDPPLALWHNGIMSRDARILSHLNLLTTNAEYLAMNKSQLLEAYSALPDVKSKENFNCFNWYSCNNCDSCYSCKYCEYCYDCYNCYNCNDCYDCNDCISCYDCYSCEYCISCRYCILCVNLSDKTTGYWLLNKEVTLGEYNLAKQELGYV